MAREPLADDEAAWWVSLDPKSGEPQLYTKEANQKMEDSYVDGAREVSLDGVGFPLPGYIIEFHVSFGLAHIQRKQGSTRVCREVWRFVVPKCETEVSLHTLFDGKRWNIVESQIDDSAIPRLVSLSFSLHVEQECYMRKVQARQDVADGKCEIWQWSHDTDVHVHSQVPDDRWGVYDEEMNQQISCSYRSGESECSIQVGVRHFKITFIGLERGWQISGNGKKWRLVRRLAVTQDVADALMKAPCQQGLPDVDGMCSLCLDEFADTHQMPVLKLTECGHCFHLVCVQDVMDKKQPCPYCRQKVQWKNAVRSIDK